MSWWHSAGRRLIDLTDWSPHETPRTTSVDVTRLPDFNSRLTPAVDEGVGVQWGKGDWLLSECGADRVVGCPNWVEKDKLVKTQEEN